jgi:hypothetical protein
MPQYPPHYPAPPQNGFGTAAFVLGLLGLLFSFIPIIGIVAWPLVILALVFGAIGLAKASGGRATNRGLSIAGLICALLGLMICILYAAAFTATVSSAPTPAVSTGLAGIGTEVRDGAFAFTVTKVDTGLRTLGQGALRSEAQGSYVLVHVTVRNVGAESELFTDSDQTLLDAQGREFTADTAAAMLNLPDSEAFLTTINPGNSVDGVLAFDVSEGVAPASIELHESMLSSGVLVSLAG